MSKEYEPEALVETEIDLDAYKSEPNTDERRIAKDDDRREIPERRFLERVVIENQPRRQNSDRRGECSMVI